jgi:hypothetical protein
MKTPEDLLQEQLERLEAGEPLEYCLVGLSAGEAELLQTAAALRQLPYPHTNQHAIASQRAHLMQLAQKELSMNEEPTKKLTFMTWLQSLTKMPGAAIALAAFALLIWLSFSLFKPDTAVKDTAVIPQPDTQTAVDTTAPNTEVAAPATTDDTEVADQEDEVEVAAVADTAVALPAYTAFLPLLDVAVAPDARTASIQEPHGVVEVQAADGTWKMAARGHLLKAGQRVRTGDFSSVQIAFYDGSQALLSANSELSIDELDAKRPQDGFRTIVLSQWLGDSEHHVDHRGDNGSRYEVKTPNGSGLARGTIFQVSVGINLLTHYTVLDGRVDVTNLNVTVIVIAGQITVINPNEPPSTPYFTVTGQGEVTEIGENWTIGGQTFATTGTTVIIGNPQVGDVAFVSGYLLPDGSLVATHIVLLHHGNENPFTITGAVESMGDDEWVVAGQTIAVTETTTIDGNIEIGDIVRVHGIFLEDNTLLAHTIDLVDDENPFEFVGIVQTIGEAAWTVSGVEVAVDADTEIEEGIVVGDVVKVEGVILPDNTWLAREIKLEEEEADFEFTGIVDSLDPWSVAGISFDVDDFTEIDEDIEVGSLVHVEGQILENGIWLATEIRLLDDDNITIQFIGTVNSIDPWVVNGLALVVDEATEIDEDIEVGDLVRVTAVIQADGTLLATEIELLDDDNQVGCFTIAAIVLSINGNQLILDGYPAITLDDSIPVNGDIQANAVIIITLCMGEDGTITIINIIVIYIVPPPAPEPPPPGSGGNGGKVTVCHKGRNTLNISQSALGAHLGHGDTVGPCN